MQSEQALETRIEGLERQVRIGRRWIFALGGILACLGLQALAGPGQSSEVPEVITARMFKVVDKNGRLRATLGSDHTGPDTNALCLWDSIKEGRTDLALRLKASDGGAEIELPGSVDRGRILISNLLFEKESSITLYSMCENEVHGLPFGGGVGSRSV